MTNDQLAFWGFVLALAALLATVPLAILGNILTPKVKDWWASRSFKSLQSRIARLEQELTTAPTIEECLVSALKKSLWGLFMLVCLVLSLGFTTLLQIQKAEVSMVKPATTFLESHLTLGIPFVFIGMTILVLPAVMFKSALRDIEKLRYGKEAEYWRKQTERRLAGLHSKLEKLKPNC